MSLFGVVENWIEGKQNFSDVESKIVSLVTTTYSKDVQPMLDTFLAQFETDFGKAALAAAASAAARYG